MATRRTAKKSLYKGIDHLSPSDRELVIDKVTSSGLDLDDFMLLGMEALSAKQTLNVHHLFRQVPSIKINYWDPKDPSKPLTPLPKWPQFFRLRYLESPTDFASLAEKKPQRYIQPPGSGLCAYFPRNLPDGQTWAKIMADPDVPLIITEGEFKAAKATKEGYPTIGLGGVDSFKSSQLGFDFLPELEQVNWIKRHVYIIYDSDFRSNENVCAALNRLAEALMSRGALPKVVPLPEVLEDGAKTGLDDFLVARSADELAGLLRTAAQPLTLVQSLWKLNSQVIYIYNPGLIIERETGTKLSPNAFTSHAYATASYSENVMSKDGRLSLKAVSGAQAWISWPLRAEAGQLTYAPGKPKFIEADHPRRTAWNTWVGWGVEPRKGDVKPFLKLVEHIFTGAEPGVLDWFYDWLAYPLQYPGTKLYSSCLIYGIRHGTGKSLIGYTMGRIYGKNFTEISGSELHASFNEWAENKQFVLGDDVSGSDKREDNDRLKKMITQKWLRVNAKFLPTYEIPDCINYMFTSNQPDAFFLEDDDRRTMVHEVIVGPLDEAWYREYELWLDSGGASAIFDWLLRRDTSGFNPTGRAIMTEAKRRMISDVKSDLGSWVNKLLHDPDAVLKVGDIPVEGDLFTNKELLELYDPHGRTRTTANGLGRELRKSGAQMLAKGNPVRTPNGQDRYYIIRNQNKWVKASTKEIQEYFTKAEKKAAAKKKY